MFTPSLKRVVASECISVVHRPFPGMLPYMCHQFIGTYLLHNLGINPPITLKKPKYNAFSTCTTTSSAFSSASKVCLINFNLSLEFPCFKLCHMVDRFAYPVIYSGHRLIIYS